jgi:hypothetical protein
MVKLIMAKLKYTKLNWTKLNHGLNIYYKFLNFIFQIYFHWVIIIIKNVLQSSLKWKKQRSNEKLTRRKIRKISSPSYKTICFSSLDPSYFQTS